MPATDVTEILLRVRIDQAQSNAVLARLKEVDRAISTMGATADAAASDIREALGKAFAELNQRNELKRIAADFVTFREQGGSAADGIEAMVNQLKTFAQTHGDVRFVAEEIERLNRAAAKMEARRLPSQTPRQDFAVGFNEAADQGDVQAIVQRFTELREQGVHFAVAVQRAHKEMQDLRNGTGATTEEARQLGAEFERVNRLITAQQEASRGPQFEKRFNTAFAKAGDFQQLDVVVQKFQQALEAGRPLDDVVNEARLAVEALGITGDKELAKLAERLREAQAEAGRLASMPSIRSQLEGTLSEGARADQIRQVAVAYEEARRSGTAMAAATADADAKLASLAAKPDEIQRVGRAMADAETRIKGAASATEIFTREFQDLGRRNEIKRLAADYIATTKNARDTTVQLKKLHDELMKIGATGDEMAFVRQQVEQMGGRAGKGASFNNMQLRGLGRVGQEIFYLPDIGPSTEISRAFRLLDLGSQKIEQMGASAGGAALGVAALAAGLTAIAAVGYAFAQAMAASKRTAEAAIGAQEAYYKALDEGTTESITADIAALQRTTDLMRRNRDDLRAVAAEGFDAISNMFGAQFDSGLTDPIVDVVRDALTRLAVGGSGFNDLTVAADELDKKIQENDRTIANWTASLGTAEVAMNDAAQAARDQAAAQVAAETAAAKGRVTARNLILGADLDAFDAEMQRLTLAINDIVAEQSAQLALGTKEGLERAKQLGIDLANAQAEQTQITAVGPAVAAADAFAQAQRDNVAMFQQQIALLNEVNSIIEAGNTTALQARIDALNREQNILNAYIPIFKSMATSSPEAQAALDAFTARVKLIPDALRVLTGAMPQTLQSEMEQVTADVIQNWHEVTDAAEDFARSATPVELQERIAELERSSQSLVDTNQALAATGTKAAAEQIKVNDAQIVQIQLQIQAAKATEGYVALLEAERQARDLLAGVAEEYLQNLEDQRDFQRELNDLLEEGTSDDVREAVDARQEEIAAIAQTYPILKLMSLVHDDYAAAATEAEDRVRLLVEQILNLAGISPDVLARETETSAAEGEIRRGQALNEAFQFAQDTDIEGLAGRMADLRANTAFLRDENRRLAGNTSELAQQTREANQAQVDENNAVLQLLVSLRGSVEAREAEAAAMDAALAVWDRRVALETELADLLATGTVEAIDERIDAIERERQVLLENLPALREQAKTNAEAAERVAEVETEIRGLTTEMYRLAQIQPEVGLRQFNDELAEMEDKLAEQTRAIEARRDERIRELGIKRTQDEEDALTDRDDKLADLRDESHEKEEEAQADHQDKMLKLAEDDARKRREIEREFRRDARSAIGARDALALQEAMERRDDELEDLRENRERQREEIDEAYEEQLDEIKDNLAEQRQAIQTAYERRLRDIEISNRREIEAEHRKATAEISLLQQAHAREVADLRSRLMTQFGLQNQFWDAVEALARRKIASIQAIQTPPMHIAPGTPGRVTTTIPEFAQGGFITRSGLIDAHAGEGIGPLSSLAGMFSNAIQGMYEPRTGGGMMFNIQISGLNRTLDQITDAVIDELDAAYQEAGWRDD